MQKQWGNHKGLLVDTKDQFDVIECQKCRFKHIIPIPSEDELIHFYAHEFYTKEKPLYLERTQEDLAWWNIVYADRFNTFEEHLPQHRRKFLDVGSGPGYFLLHGKKRGWDGTGLEPSRAAAEHSRALGLNIIEAYLDWTVSKQLDRFDCIHMSEVLEHVPHPIEILKIAYDRLSNEGLICVCVPNDYNPFQKVLRDVLNFKPWWLAPPQHINYFDHRSISRLLKRLGFQVIYQEATFPIDLFLLMGDNYIGNDPLGRECHKKRKQFELHLKEGGQNDLKRAWYRNLFRMGLGRETIVFGKKQ